MDEIERYTAEATEHGRCTEIGDFKRGNAAFDRMRAALKKMRQHPDRGEAALLKLLNHPNGWVKSAAATHLLPIRPEVAYSILENLAAGPESHLEFNAKMVLQEWQAGRLKIP